MIGGIFVGYKHHDTVFEFQKSGHIIIRTRENQVGHVVSTVLRYTNVDFRTYCRLTVLVTVCSELQYDIFTRKSKTKCSNEKTTLGKTMPSGQGTQTTLTD